MTRAPATPATGSTDGSAGTVVDAVSGGLPVGVVDRSAWMAATAGSFTGGPPSNQDTGSGGAGVCWPAGVAGTARPTGPLGAAAGVRCSPDRCGIA